MIVADKYDMAGVKERCLAALLEPHRQWLLDSHAPASMLRCGWAALARMGEAQGSLRGV